MIDGPANPFQTAIPNDESAHRPPVEMAPLVVWLLIQLSALALSAARVPLWARAGEPVEQFAAAQMATVQVIAAALLFGWLLPNLATGIAVIVSGIPMLMLAGMLSQTPSPHLAGAAALVCAWLTMLGIFSAALRTPGGKLLGMTLATLWAAGLPIARYLAADFHHSPPPSWARGLSVDPATASVLQIQSGTWVAAMWLLLAVAMAVGALLCAGKFRATKSTAYPHP